MAVLPEILSSKVRAEIFRLLFGLVENELHVREMERRAGFSIGAVRQELKKLSRLELVQSRRDGNRLYYWANTGHPLYMDIRGLVLKTSGLVDILRRVLDKKGIKAAFIFGSLARREEGARSDVDLMVIGDVSLRALSGWLTGAPEEIGREVKPHIMSVEEFGQRKKSGEQFLSNVMGSKKIFIIGNENELGSMGR